jgi:hypothetical protein
VLDRHTERVRLLGVLLIVAGGCSIPRTPLLPSETDAPEGLDAPLPDVPGLDAPVPDGPALDVPALDVPRSDTPLSDAPACMPGCCGDVADDCAGGMRDCAAEGLVCRVMGAPVCVCADAPLACAADGRAVEGCSSGVATLELCDELGCTGSACDTPCTVPDVSATFTVDLCGRTDGSRNTGGGDCANDDSDGEDVRRRIALPVRSRVTVTLRDDDPEVDIDTIVYLRGVCNQRDTQLACDDDVPCMSATPGLGSCNGSDQWRESSFTIDLERGAYYVILDHITHSGWDCGRVTLTVEITPL